MIQSNKRLRETRAKHDDVIDITRFTRKRDGKIRSEFMDNRGFRESFDYGDHVDVSLQNLIQDNNELLSKGEIKHILQVLMFVKTCGKERTMCSLVGESDLKTFR